MNLQSQISTLLQTTKSLSLSPTWLDTFIASSSSSLQRNVPISALSQTALFRVLASDFQDTLDTNATSLLPVDIFDPNVKERRLTGPVPVQVLDIEDIGSSAWSQVEAIERVERGEAVRGREIVRTVNVGEDTNNEDGSAGVNGVNSNAGGSSRPHRLILQDAAGTRTVAIELRRIGEIVMGKMPIGTKLLLRNATVARGIVLLTPECVTVLGGKIEVLDRDWKETRKARLLARIEQTEKDER